jgi:hypothetical protein
VKKLAPVVVRWRTLLPAAKALRSWEEVGWGGRKGGRQAGRQAGRWAGRWAGRKRMSVYVGGGGGGRLRLTVALVCEQFVYQQQHLKTLFLSVFTSNNTLLLANAWAAWEELIAEAHARKVCVYSVWCVCVYGREPALEELMRARCACIVCVLGTGEPPWEELTRARCT